MALQFTNFKRKPPQKGGWRSGYVDIVLDGSYSAGGWTITAANLKLTTIYAIWPPPVGVHTGPLAYTLHWNISTGKLMAFEGNGSAGTGMQEMDAGDLSGDTIRCYYEGW